MNIYSVNLDRETTFLTLVRSHLSLQFYLTLASSSISPWPPVRSHLGLQFDLTLASSSISLWPPVRSHLGLQFDLTLASSSISPWPPVRSHLGLQFDLTLASSSISPWPPVRSWCARAAEGRRRWQSLPAGSRRPPASGSAPHASVHRLENTEKELLAHASVHRLGNIQ